MTDLEIFNNAVANAEVVQVLNQRLGKFREAMEMLTSKIQSIDERVRAIEISLAYAETSRD